MPTFDRNVLSATSTTVAAGIGTVSSTTFSSNTATVSLSGVADRQTITIELDNVVGVVGINSKVLVSMSVLIGDVNQDGAVTAEDVFLIRSHSLAAIDSSTFKYDVNADGRIDSSDVYVDRVSEINGDSLFPDFAFTGHYYHARSGLYFAPYRAYNPTIGRWLSRDPIGERGGLNLYEYVSNDPTVDFDPLGLFALMHCRRCKDNPTGELKCRFEVNEAFGEPFPANLGPNNPSETPGDPYGHNGPLPPGTFDVLPKPASQGAGFPVGQPSITGPGQARGAIVTPLGTHRQDLRIHGPPVSLGCITAACAFNPYGGPSAVQNLMNTYGLKLLIEEVTCCPGQGPSF
jgi:RHS repeat-associated protein